MEDVTGYASAVDANDRQLTVCLVRPVNQDKRLIVGVMPLVGARLQV
jgi:hypothetical protein